MVFQAEWKRILPQKRFRISGLGFRAWTLLVLEGVGESNISTVHRRLDKDSLEICSPTPL